MGTLIAMMWVFAAVVSMALTVPIVRRARQPVLPWVVACLAFPIITYGVASYFGPDKRR